MLPDLDLDGHYRRYLSSLNERQLDGLDEFVHDEITYNGAPMTRADYRELIARHIAEVPDMFFAVDLLVVRADLVACRITFDCTPQSEFLGLRPPAGASRSASTSSTGSVTGGSSRSGRCSTSTRSASSCAMTADPPVDRAELPEPIIEGDPWAEVEPYGELL